MSVIHCRVRDGKRVYRLRSTVCDGYLTDDLTREELVTELRVEAIRRALEQVEHSTPDRLDRADKKGTSDALLDPVLLDGPWEEESV